MLLKLFLICLKIGAFSFGGGYGMLPLIQKELVANLHWLTSSEFIDAIALGNITPGPLFIAVVFIGYKIAGLGGAILATAGIILPSFILTVFLALNYARIKSNETLKQIMAGIMPAVLALILFLLIDISARSVGNGRELLIALVTFIGIVRFRKIEPVFIIVLAGLTNWLLKILLF